MHYTTLLQGEPAGTEVLGDSAYGAGTFRAHLLTCKQEAVIKPGPFRSTIDGGFTIDDFTIDLDTRTVTCPAGFTVPIAPRGGARFGKRCTGCPLRARCPTSVTGRDLQIHPHHALLHAARRQAETPEFDRSIDSSGRWWSAASPGSCARAIAASPIGASTATASGSAIASPP